MKTRWLGLTMIAAIAAGFSMISSGSLSQEASPSPESEPALFAIWSEGRFGFMDSAGNIVIDPQFDGAYRFSEGLAAVRIGGLETGKWGFVDKTGAFVIDPLFDFASYFSEGLAAVRIGDLGIGKYGYIDETGNYVINPQFGYVEDFSGGLAYVRSGFGEPGKWGYIDSAGNYVWSTDEPHPSNSFLWPG